MRSLAFCAASDLSSNGQRASVGTVQSTLRNVHFSTINASDVRPSSFPESFAQPEFRLRVCRVRRRIGNNLRHNLLWLVLKDVRSHAGNDSKGSPQDDMQLIPIGYGK